jgi:hypothetical protein
MPSVASHRRRRREPLPVLVQADSVHDELEEANRLLGQLHNIMRARSAWLPAQRGTAQFWEDGPTVDCPLVLVLIDESHTYVTGASRKDRDLCDSNTWYLPSWRRKADLGAF